MGFGAVRRPPSVAFDKPAYAAVHGRTEPGGGGAPREVPGVSSAETATAVSSTDGWTPGAPPQPPSVPCAPTSHRAARLSAARGASASGRAARPSSTRAVP